MKRRRGGDLRTKAVVRFDLKPVGETRASRASQLFQCTQADMLNIVSSREGGGLCLDASHLIVISNNHMDKTDSSDRPDCTLNSIAATKSQTGLPLRNVSVMQHSTLSPGRSNTNA